LEPFTVRIEAGIIGLAAVAGYGWAATQSVRYPAPWSAPWRVGRIRSWDAAGNAAIRLAVLGGIAIAIAAAWPHEWSPPTSFTRGYGLGWFPLVPPNHFAFTLPDLKWLWLAIGSIALGFLVVTRIRQGRGRAQPNAEAGALASDGPSLTTAVDEALGAMMLESDPRRAILACYQQMERALARRGVSRHPEETALEFARRLLDQSGAPAMPVQTLTSLFQLAGFSARAINETMRENAINSLLLIRESAK